MERLPYIVDGTDFSDYLHYKSSDKTLRLSGSQSLDRLVIKTDNRRGTPISGKGVR